MHQTVGNVLRTYLYSNPPQNMTQAKDTSDQVLATAMHVMCTTITTTLGSTPGSLAFSRDMFLNTIDCGLASKLIMPGTVGQL